MPGDVSPSGRPPLRIGEPEGLPASPFRTGSADSAPSTAPSNGLMTGDQMGPSERSYSARQTLQAPVLWSIPCAATFLIGIAAAGMRTELGPSIGVSRFRHAGKQRCDGMRLS
jgi:hypothetical protein